jgi:hypothetical protein
VKLQQAYVAEFTAGGAHKKKGNGGFFFACYLGSYFEMLFDGGPVPPQTSKNHCVCRLSGLSVLQSPIIYTSVSVWRVCVGAQGT